MYTNCALTVKQLFYKPEEGEVGGGRLMVVAVVGVRGGFLHDFHGWPLLAPPPPPFLPH